MNLRIYEDISKRTGNDIYLGVVGPVRSGKSTFIKKMMDVLVIPNIENKFKQERAIDELPQSGSGKTVTTCEPKFVPNDTANIHLGDNLNLNVRLVDCVGYVIPGSMGISENGEERLVNTPWSDEPMKFSKAAHMGTKKVIETHSTIGVVVTTDGSITGIDRENYEQAEEEVINDLKKINKPFVIILNSTNPGGNTANKIKNEMEEKYGTDVLLLDVLNMSVNDIEDILTSVLYKFPVKEITYELPMWLGAIGEDSDINKEIMDFILLNSNDNDCINDVTNGFKSDNDNFHIGLDNIDLSNGSIHANVDVQSKVFYDILNGKNDVEVNNETDLFNLIANLTNVKKEYDKIANALSVARAEGYGIVLPEFEDYSLDEPEMINKSSNHGIKIKAKAPALHIICTDVETSVTPTIGSESECQVFYDKILDEYKNEQDKIWESEFFGRNLKNMISDNMRNKITSINDDNKVKVKKVLTKVVNNGKGGLIILWM